MTQGAFRLQALCIMVALRSLVSLAPCGQCSSSGLIGPAASRKPPCLGPLKVDLRAEAPPMMRGPARDLSSLGVGVWGSV